MKIDLKHVQRILKDIQSMEGIDAQTVEYFDEHMFLGIFFQPNSISRHM